MRNESRYNMLAIPHRWVVSSRWTRTAIGFVAFCSLIASQSVIAQTTPPSVNVQDIASSILDTSVSPARKRNIARIDSTLLSVAEEHRRFRARVPAPGERFATSTRGVRVSTNEEVLIDLVAAESPASLINALTPLGLRDASQRGRIVSGWLPFATLDRLPQLAVVRTARPVLFRTFAGAALSHGDEALRAGSARSAYSIDGSGVMVGVISDSYNCRNGASSDIASGDLPTTVLVLKDASVSACPSATDEGRAMMQIVHDLAPGTNLAFHTAINGMADFANGIAALRNSGNARVIVDDVLYYAEPMFQDGLITQAVDTVVGQGVMYFSAAGNLATQSYESAFRGTGIYGALTHGERHDFDPGSGVTDRQPVTIPANQGVVVVLQWNQPFFSVSGGSGASTDLDLVLYNAAGTPVAAGLTDNSGADAVEVLSYFNSGTATTFQIGIERFSGPAPTLVKYVWSGSMTPQQFATNSSTLYGHANAAGARAVGASYFRNTPSYGVSPPVVNSYSSLGGTPILFDASGASQFITRPKPEIVATDGGDTTFFGTDVDSNGFPNFFGTSAAAPHAAALAALLTQFAPTDPTTEKSAALIEGAIDMSAAGFDYRTGVGLVQADAALAWASQSTDAAGIGFRSSGNGVPTLGSVSTSAYQSQGLMLQVSGRSDGYASLSAAPSTGTTAGFDGPSLLANGASGNAFVSLQFPTPVTAITFAFATASGQIKVEIYDPGGVLLTTTTLNRTTSISFSGAARLGGMVSLPELGPVGQVIVRTVGTDADLRIDSIGFRVYDASASADSADAPMLPVWAMALLAGVLGLTLVERARLSAHNRERSPRLRSASA